MRVTSISSALFTGNRERLRAMLRPNSVVVANSNDLLPNNADALNVLHQNSDLFYLTGVNQEQSMLLLYPDSQEERFREILFIRESSELLTTWEGHKLTKEKAKAISGVARVEWLTDFPGIFHRVMCECDHVYLNSNEHKRAVVEVETRESRFVQQTLEKYPLHSYQRLARLMHQLRVVKSDLEIEQIRQSCDLTGKGFRRLLKFVKPGVTETEIEAELAHEFIRAGGQFAYPPIIASGPNNNVLHYNENDQPCAAGGLVLLDVAACQSYYNSDLTRTIPISGKYTQRQKQVYNAVLRVFRAGTAMLKPGKFIKDWQRDAEELMQEELLKLGLLKSSEVKKQDPASPLLKRYFMHGLGHPIGLDVHDVGLTTQPMQAGWVMTCEPGIYIKEEGFGVRLENTILVGPDGPIDLMADIPIEASEIEALMK